MDFHRTYKYNCRAIVLMILILPILLNITKACYIPIYHYPEDYPYLLNPPVLTEYPSPIYRAITRYSTAVTHKTVTERPNTVKNRAPNSGTTKITPYSGTTKKIDVTARSSTLITTSSTEKTTTAPVFLLLLVTAAQARISVMYAHDKQSDMIAEQCLTEMYPRTRRTELQESDESCIIFCVLKKLGIMNTNGNINLEAYRKRLHVAHQVDRSTMNDYGGSCVENAEVTQHKQDVCKKAKVFNDCTHLYRILL